MDYLTQQIPTQSLKMVSERMALKPDNYVYEV